MSDPDMSSLKEKLRVYRQREVAGAVLGIIGLALLALQSINPVRNIFVTLILPITIVGIFISVYYEREIMALKIAIKNSTQAYAMY